MGTLFNQRIRARHGIQILGTSRSWAGDLKHKTDDVTTLESTVKDLMTLSESTGVPITDLISLWHVLETNRTNNITVEDCDAKDEQLAGLGKLFQEYIQVLDDIKAPLYHIAVALGDKYEPNKH